MSVVPHTAGPLSAQNEGGFTVQDMHDGTFTIWGSGCMSLARVFDDLQLAHQFAGAPEMLAALHKAKEVIKARHGDGGWEFYDLHSPEMKQINAAIAKAERRVAA